MRIYQVVEPVWRIWVSCWIIATSPLIANNIVSNMCQYTIDPPVATHVRLTSVHQSVFFPYHADTPLSTQKKRDPPEKKPCPAGLFIFYFFGGGWAKIRRMWTKIKVHPMKNMETSTPGGYTTKPMQELPGSLYPAGKMGRDSYTMKLKPDWHSIINWPDWCDLVAPLCLIFVRAIYIRLMQQKGLLFVS